VISPNGRRKDIYLAAQHLMNEIKFFNDNTMIIDNSSSRRDIILWTDLLSDDGIIGSMISLLLYDDDTI